MYHPLLQTHLSDSLLSEQGFVGRGFVECRCFGPTEPFIGQMRAVGLTFQNVSIICRRGMPRDSNYSILYGRKIER